MSLPGLISLGSLPPHLFDAMFLNPRIWFLNPRIWLPRNCSLFLLSHPPTDSEVSYFFDGLQTSPLIRQVEGLKDVREWSIMPTHSLNGSLEVQETFFLDRSGKLCPKSSSIRSLVRDNAAAGLLHRVQNGLAIPGED